HVLFEVLVGVRAEHVERRQRPDSQGEKDPPLVPREDERLAPIELPQTRIEPLPVVVRQGVGALGVGEGAGVGRGRNSDEQQCKERDQELAVHVRTSPARRSQTTRPMPKNTTLTRTSAMRPPFLVLSQCPVPEELPGRSRKGSWGASMGRGEPMK